MYYVNLKYEVILGSSITVSP